MGKAILAIAESGWDVGGEEAMREVRAPRIGTRSTGADRSTVDCQITPCWHYTSGSTQPVLIHECEISRVSFDLQYFIYYSRLPQCRLEMKLDEPRPSRPQRFQGFGA